MCFITCFQAKKGWRAIHKNSGSIATTYPSLLMVMRSVRITTLSVEEEISSLHSHLSMCYQLVELEEAETATPSKPPTLNIVSNLLSHPLMLFGMCKVLYLTFTNMNMQLSISTTNTNEIINKTETLQSYIPLY